jgi:hypothetical protein
MPPLLRAILSLSESVSYGRSRQIRVPALAAPNLSGHPDTVHA